MYIVPSLDQPILNHSNSGPEHHISIQFFIPKILYLRFFAFSSHLRNLLGERTISTTSTIITEKYTSVGENYLILKWGIALFSSLTIEISQIILPQCQQLRSLLGWSHENVSWWSSVVS